MLFKISIDPDGDTDDFQSLFSFSLFKDTFLIKFRR